MEEARFTSETISSRRLGRNPRITFRDANCMVPLKWFSCKDRVMYELGQHILNVITFAVSMFAGSWCPNASAQFVDIPKSTRYDSKSFSLWNKFHSDIPIVPLLSEGYLLPNYSLLGLNLVLILSSTHQRGIFWNSCNQNIRHWNISMNQSSAMHVFQSRYNLLSAAKSYGQPPVWSNNINYDQKI